MSQDREDLDGILPAPLLDFGEVPVDRAGMYLAGAATGGRWLIDGEACRISGVQSSASMTVDFPGHASVEVRSDAGVVANLVVYPGLARREQVGPAGSVSAWALCPPTLPMAVFQWSGAGPASVGVIWPDATVVIDHSGVRFVDNDNRPLGAAWILSGGTARASEDGARLDLHPNRSLRSIVLVSGDEAIQARCLAALPHMRGHMLAASRARDEDRLRVASGVDEIDSGVRWLSARTGARAVNAEPSSPEILALGLATLARGAWEDTRTLLQALPSDSSERAFLSARYTMSTGEIGPARECALSLLQGDYILDGTLGAEALTGLADALRFGATPGEISELRTMSRALRSASPSPSGRRLPTIGAPQPESGLTTLVQGKPRTGLAGRFRSDPDAAWVEWRQRLGEGLEADGVGLGLWSDDGGREAELVLALMHGWLGFSADAPSGRFHLRPVIPSHWTHFALHGIPFGDAAVTLDYEVRGGAHRFTLSAERGGVPSSLIFEPNVRGEAARVFVDGAEADLEKEYAASRSLVRLELPLDATRLVVIESV